MQSWWRELFRAKLALNISTLFLSVKLLSAYPNKITNFEWNSFGNACTVVLKIRIKQKKFKNTLAYFFEPKWFFMHQLNGRKKNSSFIKAFPAKGQNSFNSVYASPYHTARNMKAWMKGKKIDSRKNGKLNMTWEKKNLVWMKLLIFTYTHPYVLCFCCCSSIEFWSLFSSQRNCVKT